MQYEKKSVSWPPVLFTLMSRTNAARTSRSKIFVPMKSGNLNLPFVAAPDLTVGLTCP